MSIIAVAKRAGVSTATVSRVMNDLPGVRSETAAQVWAAVQELDYKPQRAKSRQKKLGPQQRFEREALRFTTGNIAVMTLGSPKNWLQLPLMAAVTLGIQRGAAELGLQLFLDEMPDPRKPTKLIERRQIDGAVVFVSSDSTISSHAEALATLRKHVPVVCVMGLEMTDAGFDHIAPNHVAVGHLAHAYLASQGCRDLAFLTANPDWHLMRLRAHAFLSAACDAGRPQSATCYLETRNEANAFSYGRQVVLAPSLEQLVAQLVQARPRPTGLFIGNDATTARVYPMLAKHGLQVGKDITVVSCDNEEVWLSALYPLPPSIDLGADEIGLRAVSRLAARVQRPDDPPLVIHVTPGLEGFSPVGDFVKREV